MGFYVVAIVHEWMCYGGPEEGGWWYDAGEPVTEGDAPQFTKVLDNEDAAYDYCRCLNETVVDNMNKEAFDHEYSSVCGGERFAAYIYEDEYPKPYPEERPHYE